MVGSERKGEHKVEVMLVVVTNIGVTNHHLNILLQTCLYFSRTLRSRFAKELRC